MFQVKGIDKIVNDIILLNTNMKPLIEQSFGAISERFIEEIRDTQMSGRPGVNEITGILKRSLMHEEKVTELEKSSTIYSDCVYIAVHQYGYQERSIPKRLNIVELMVSKYEKEYSTAVLNVVDKYL